jgi:hypothetical protein
VNTTLQECSSMSGDVHKSGAFYSGHVLWIQHSRSVLACSEMCTSPELFTPDMDCGYNTLGVF